MKAAIVYSPKRAFFLTEKCAHNTLWAVLTERYGWQDLPRASLTVLKQENPTDVARMTLGPLGPHGLEQRTTYAVRRNPFDRMVSTWWDVTHGARHANGNLLAAAGDERFVSFVRFVVSMDRQSYSGRRSIYQTQTGWLCGMRVDEWLAFERLDDDFARLPFTDGRELPRLNRSGTHRQPWPWYYCAETMERVAEWAAEDFEAFGYPTTIELTEAVAS